MIKLRRVQPREPNTRCPGEGIKRRSTMNAFRIGPRWPSILTPLMLLSVAVSAQQSRTQAQDEDFARSVKEWTTKPEFISPLVDHLPRVPGVPSPKDVLGHHIGAPGKLTYHAEAVNYY